MLAVGNSFKNPRPVLMATLFANPGSTSLTVGHVIPAMPTKTKKTPQVFLVRV